MCIVVFDKQRGWPSGALTNRADYTALAGFHIWRERERSKPSWTGGVVRRSWMRMSQQGLGEGGSFSKQEGPCWGCMPTGYGHVFWHPRCAARYSGVTGCRNSSAVVSEAESPVFLFDACSFSSM